MQPLNVHRCPLIFNHARSPVDDDSCNCAGMPQPCSTETNSWGQAAIPQLAKDGALFSALLRILETTIRLAVSRVLVDRLIHRKRNLHK